MKHPVIDGTLDRRHASARRRYTRGGRRRTDWPAEALNQMCPRCRSAELKFVDATPNEYFWACHTCRHDFSVGRTTLLAG
jgi:hypothetical protein